MKKLLFSLFLGFGAMYSAYCQTTFSETFTVANNTGITNFLSFPAKVTRIVITTSAGNAATLTYAFLDADDTNLFGANPRKYPFAAYASSTSYRTNMIRLLTNYDGATNFTLYRSNVLFTYTNTVAAGSNDFRTVVSGNTATPSTVTLDFSSAPLYLAVGLSYTNTGLNTNISVTVTYDPSL